jgi:predicted MFS family arabinose efflux permease
MWREIPYMPLFATLFVQALATMSAYSIPAAAPAIAADVGVDGARVGLFISIVYGVGIFSAVLSPSFVHRFGAVRVSQVILVCTIIMLLTAALGGTAGAIALGGVLLGFAYGATAPSSSHLLISRTPVRLRNLVFSIRQIGVPLGGVMGGLLVPPLVLGFDWQTALLVQLGPAILLLVLLQAMRTEYDADRDVARALTRGNALAPLRLLVELPEVRTLCIAMFCYAGAQLCFIAFMAVHLTSMAEMSLIRAGQALAMFQVAGVISRPIWGWMADNVISARLLLALHGIVMAGTALAAGQFGADWSYALILLVCAVAGATASGFTGIAFAEYARIGGPGRTAESSGLAAAMMFLGVMSMPAIFSVMIASGQSYGVAYGAVAIVTGLSGLMLLRRGG